MRDGFVAKYVVMWSDGYATGFDSYTRLHDYMKKCNDSGTCSDLEHRVYCIDDNKIRELDL